MAIKIDILDKKKNKTKVLIKGLDETYINTLRRLMMNEVPVLAIEDVEIKRNDSILYDEIVAHRLGLIPLKTDPKSYDLLKPGEPLNAKNSLKLTLKAKGPGYVYASQIKSTDPKAIPIYPDMPITKLLENQHLELEATAVMGQGKTHAKWSSGLFYFHQATIVTIKKQPDNKEEIAKLFPPGLLEVKNNKLVVADEIMAQEAEDFENIHDVVDITLDDSFVFVMEPWGQLTLKETVQEAIRQFDEELETFQELIKESK